MDERGGGSPDPGASPRSLDQPGTGATIDLGVAVAPGLAREVIAGVAEDLLADLRQRYGSVGWSTSLTVDRLVVPPVPTTELIAAARRKLLERDWDLGVVVTDLPLRLGGRTLSRYVSPTLGIAVVSLPALGPLHLHQRLRATLLDLVSALVRDDDREGTARERRWRSNVLRELATEIDDRPGAQRLAFVPAVLLSHLRLLLGMVRANRPWRFAARLYGALVAAAAVGAYGVVTSDIWRLSASMSWWRLTVTSIVAVAVTIVAIIVVHGLWERAPDPRVRDQVVLFNVATSLSVTIGIVSLYAALFALVLGAAELLVAPSAFSHAIGGDAGPVDYLVLAWFVASFAAIAGGLGAGLESNEAIREAAYASNVATDNSSDIAPGPGAGSERGAAS